MAKKKVPASAMYKQVEPANAENMGYAIRPSMDNGQYTGDDPYASIKRTYRADETT